MLKDKCCNLLNRGQGDHGITLPPAVHHDCQAFVAPPEQPVAVVIQTNVPANPIKSASLTSQGLLTDHSGNKN